MPDYEEIMERKEKEAIHNGTQVPLWSSGHQISDMEVYNLLRVEEGISLKFVPGTNWSYSNSGYILLGLVVAKLSGMTFSDFLEREVFRPLGMVKTVAYVRGVNAVPNRVYGHAISSEKGFLGENDQSSTSATLGDGGIYSSLDDLERWDSFLDQLTRTEENEDIDKLRGDAIWFLRGRTVEGMFTPFALPNSGFPKWSSGPGDSDPLDGGDVMYGFGWFLNPLETGHKTYERMWHYGETCGFRSCIQRFRWTDGEQLMGARLTVVVLTNRTDIDPIALSIRIALSLLV